MQQWFPNQCPRINISFCCWRAFCVSTFNYVAPPRRTISCGRRRIEVTFAKVPQQLGRRRANETTQEKPSFRNCCTKGLSVRNSSPSGFVTTCTGPFGPSVADTSHPGGNWIFFFRNIMMLAVRPSSSGEELDSSAFGAVLVANALRGLSTRK